MPTSTGYLNQFENNGVYYDLHDTDLRSKIGQANGIAELDANGKVPSGQLPSYVDEVTDAYYADGEMYIVPTYEGYLYEGDFYKDEDHTELITPEADTYYFDKTGEKYYQYSALAYVEVSPPTPITPASDKIYVNIAVNPAEIYRWTGSTYVKVSSGNGGVTYTFENGVNGFTVTPSGGSAQTVTVTPSIENNVTGSGTNGYLTKFNGTNTVANGPQLGSSISSQTQSTKFLREDGVWSAPSYTTDTNDAVSQTNSSDNGDYRILLSNTADNTTRTEGSKKSAQFTANPSTGKLFSTRATHRAYNNALTGSGTEAKDNGTAASPHRYVPAIWTFNSGTTATEGDIYTITVPVAGHSYGVWLSVNNGTNYYPVAYQSSAALTTHFGTGVVISVTFDADGSVSNIYALDGSDARDTRSGGCFRVLNAYDSGNTNTAVTQTATTANANYEVLFSVTADNTTRTEGARKNNNLLFNPSTGNLQATQLNGVNIGSSPKFSDTTYNFAGSTFNSGSNGVSTHDANSIKTNGVYYYSSNGPSTAQMDFQTNDGGLYAQFHSTTWGGQIAQDYRTGKLAVRALSSSAWQTWKQVMLFEDTFGLAYDANKFVFYPSTRTIQAIGRSSAAWNTQVYSRHGYKDNIKLTFKALQTNMAMMLGFDTNPTEDSNYNKIDFAIYLTNGAKLYACESGTQTNLNTTYAVGDEFSLEYSGGYIRYYYNGVLKREVARSIGDTLYFDSSFHGVSGAVSDFFFGPMANTTYTFAGGTNKFTVTPSGGTAQDVTITPSITNNVTGSGTNGYIAKFNGANTITNGPAIGTDTTKYLRNDGTWAVTPNDDTKNSAGSSNSTSKLFLVGATSQATTAVTYSNSAIYATNGTLTATNFSGNLNNLSISLVT